MLNYVDLRKVEKYADEVIEVFIRNGLTIKDAKYALRRVEEKLNDSKVSTTFYQADKLKGRI